LCGFAAARQQNDQYFSALRVINAISGSDIKFQFANPAELYSMLTRISVDQPIDAGLNSRESDSVSQTAEPRVERGRRFQIHLF
jgi:hypothetical protein